MKSRVSQKWLFSITAGFGLLGMALGQLIQGRFDLSIILGALTGALVIFLVEWIKNRTKKDKTPEFDERTRQNILKYYAVIPNIFIGDSFLLLAIVTTGGIDKISIQHLWIVIIAYIMISGIGGVIVIRK